MGLPEHPPEKLTIFVQGEILIIFLGNIVGWRRDHQMDGVVRQLFHGLAALAEHTIHNIPGEHFFLRWSGCLVRWRAVETAVVKTGGIVADAA
jgi:hypothetical protein